MSQFGFQLLVYIPLSTKGRELGFFILGKHEPGQLSPEELSLLSSIGKQIGVAMENAHLYEQAEQTAITAERNRLARELHDAVTQTLFSANLIADVIPRIWKRNPEEGIAEPGGTAPVDARCAGRDEDVAVGDAPRILGAG